MSSSQSVAPTLFSGVGGVLGCGFSRHQLPANSHYFSRNKYPDFSAEYHCLDLAHTNAAQRLVSDLKPKIIVHAACISSAVECEANPELCQRVNVDSVKEIAVAASRSNSHLVYISTEQVFDGSNQFYDEDSALSPATAYGRSKALAEALVLDSGGCVVRLPLLLGPNYQSSGGGADYALLAALKNNKSPGLFADEWRAPVAADVVWPMIKQLGERKIRGVFHLAGADVVTRYQLGHLVCEAAKVAPSFLQSSIADFSGPRRSPRLALRSLSAQKVLGYRPPSLGETLRRLHS